MSDLVNHGLEDLANSGKLQFALDAITNEQCKGASVILYHRGQTHIATTTSVPDFTEATPVQIGCMAKTLTATLFGLALYEKRLNLDDDVSRFFESMLMDEVAREKLSLVKICHLLNHTHGFDDSAIKNVPQLANGRIDMQDLCTRLFEAPTFAAPGILFNYTNIGYWIAAAILEQVYNKTYAEILREKLFTPFDIGSKVSATHVCPAGGGDLRLSSSDFLKVAQLYFSTAGEDKQRALCFSELRGNYSYVPSEWNPAAKRICLGSYDFGDGCFGHGGRGTSESTLFRFFPETGSAIAVTAAHELLAHKILVGVFGSILSSATDLRPPRLLKPDEWAAIDPTVYEGTYANKAMSIVVDATGNKSLRARVFKFEDANDAVDDPYIKRTLSPAQNNAFLPMPPEPIVLNLLCFSHPRPDGKYQYLNAFPRVFARRSVTD